MEFIYLRLDMTHPSYNGALAALRAIHEQQGGFKLGVRTNKDATEAIVKVVGMTRAAASGSAWAGAIARTYRSDEASQLRSMVKGAAWIKE